MEEAKACAISDVSLAAFLRCRGYRIKEVRPDGRKTEWVFEAVPPAEILAYYNGTAEANVRDLLNCFREMKGLSYQRI